MLSKAGSFIFLSLFVVPLLLGAAFGSSDLITSLDTKNVTSTTTVASSTTETPESTTTVDPVTTTSATPSAPGAFPQAFEYKLNNTKNVTCLDSKMAIQFNLNGTLVNVTGATIANQYTCPSNVNATEIPLMLNFSNYNLNILFKRNLSDNSTWLGLLVLSNSLNNESFIFNETLFKAPGLKGYLCDSETSIVSLNGTQFKASFRHVHLSHPFHLSEKELMIDGQVVCQADDDLDRVIPIAVGLALLVLVAIVLIAYFVGRRRSRRLSYQSV